MLKEHWQLPGAGVCAVGGSRFTESICTPAKSIPAQAWTSLTQPNNRKLPRSFLTKSSVFCELAELVKRSGKPRGLCQVSRGSERREKQELISGGIFLALWLIVSWVCMLKWCRDADYREPPSFQQHLKLSVNTSQSESNSWFHALSFMLSFPLLPSSFMLSCCSVEVPLPKKTFPIEKVGFFLNECHWRSSEFGRGHNYCNWSVWKRQNYGNKCFKLSCLLWNGVTNQPSSNAVLCGTTFQTRYWQKKPKM